LSNQIYFINPQSSRIGYHLYWVLPCGYCLCKHLWAHDGTGLDNKETNKQTNKQKPGLVQIPKNCSGIDSMVTIQVFCLSLIREVSGYQQESGCWAAQCTEIFKWNISRAWFHTL